MNVDVGSNDPSKEKPIDHKKAGFKKKKSPKPAILH
jgi:hypothetical protein